MGNAAALALLARLPDPEKGQLPQAAWFKTYSSILRHLLSYETGGIESGMLRFAKASGGTYPARSASPNVFPIKFREIPDYTSAAGNQTVTKANRHSDSDPDDYVLNLPCLNGWRFTYYIPENTDLWVFGLAGKWFTWFDNGPLVPFKSQGSGLTAYNSSTGARGSGTCDIYYNVAGGTVTDTTVDATVYNPGAAFAANKWGVAAYNAVGELEAVVEPC